jgi:hypothetical protein
MRRVVLLAAVLVVAGCGGLSANQVLSGAQERTAGFETLRFSVDGSAGGHRFGGEGAVDNRARRSQLSVDLGAEGDAEFVLDGSVLYVRVDGLRHAPPLATPWVSADLETFGAVLGDRLGELTEWAAEGPSRLLEQLRAVGKVEELGRERVRGVETTRYRALVRPPGAPGERAVPVDVWIDGDGLVRRLHAAHAAAGATVTVELYDFGTDVAAEPPAPEQVTALDELLKASG